METLIPEKTFRELRPYQQEVFEWAVPRNNIALFLKMRMGKTILAIRWFEARGHKRVLIICPLAVVPTWQDELEKEGIEAVVLHQRYGKELIAELSDVDKLVAVTHYEAIRHQDYGQWNWDCVILDESPRIRKPDIKLTRNVVNYFADVPNKAILSGCPAPENQLDYFMQFKFMYGSFMGMEHYTTFKENFMFRNFSGKLVPIPGMGKAMEQYVAENAYVLDYKNIGFEDNKVLIKRYCNLSPENQEIYDSVELDFEFEGNETKWAIVVSNWLHQLAGGFPKNKAFQSDHKIKEIKELVKGELANEQIVILCRFTNEIKAVADLLGKECKVIRGGTAIWERDSIVREFQRGKLKYIVAQVKCLQYGLNLSHANTIIFYNNSWEFEQRFQALQRIVDLEKKEPSLIIDLITKNSIDEDIYGALETKGKNFSDFMHSVYKRFCIRVGKKHEEHENLQHT